MFVSFLQLRKTFIMIYGVPVPVQVTKGFHSKLMYRSIIKEFKECSSSFDKNNSNLLNIVCVTIVSVS